MCSARLQVRFVSASDPYEQAREENHKDILQCAAWLEGGVPVLEKYLLVRQALEPVDRYFKELLYLSSVQFVVRVGCIIREYFFKSIMRHLIL